jgi:hypothetical protein
MLMMVMAMMLEDDDDDDDDDDGASAAQHTGYSHVLSRCGLLLQCITHNITPHMTCAFL